MKILVGNYSGSVGKTVIATHLLKPRMPGATIFAMETINQSASDLGVAEVEQFKGKRFGELLERLVLEDSAIIDVGASNIEAFLEAMSRFAGAVDEFDVFVIPVTSEQKAWQESLKTVEALLSIGVDPQKIRLLPNRIENDPAEEIPAVYKYAKQKKVWISSDAYIYESEIFGYLAHKKLSFDSLIDEQVDYRALAKAESDPEKAKEFARLYRWTKLAIPIRNNLDECFAALVG